MNLAGSFTIRSLSPENSSFSSVDKLSCDDRISYKSSPVLARIAPFLVFLVLANVIFSTPLYAQITPAISLSAEEREWLNAHPVIRIGMDANYAPYSFVTLDGEYQGVAPDLITRISKILGVHFEIVPNLSWSQIIQGAKERSLDTIATAVWTPDREKFLNFTDIYIPTPLVIMTRKGDERINAAEDLARKKIALVHGYSSSQKVIREHPSIEQLQVDTVLEGLRAVAIGESDAYVGVLGVNVFLASKHGIHNLQVAGSYEMETNGQRIAVRKDWPELVSILDKSIKAIPESDRISILNKWVPIEVPKKKLQPLHLTANEKRWLSEHKEIRLAIDPEFAPVEFIDEQGNYSGISADYVKRLSEQLDIRINVVPGLTWSQALELAKKGEVDVFSAITPTRERREYLNFTSPYFKYPVVIYTRSDSHILSGMDSLTQKKVSVVRDYFVHEMVRQHYPELDIYAADSIHDGLSAVSTGSVDAFIGDIATTTFVMRKHNLTNLKISAPAEITTEGHAFGVRKDWPELVSIINKAMATIPPEEHLAISKKWVEINVEKFPRYWIWLALAAAGLMLIFFVASTILRKQVRSRTAELGLKNELLKKENHERQRAENALIDSEQRLNQFFHATFEMVFFHNNGSILDANPASLKMTGYTPEEIMGKNLIEFVTEDSRTNVISNMSTGTEEPYEANIITKAGDVMPVEIHATNIYMDGHVVRVVSLRDITERKRSEKALQHAYDMLEVKVEERTAELSLANTRLKELDQLKSMFIASVSHELRTPLNSIIGFSSMMMHGTYGELGDKYKDYIARINCSGQHLLSLITDVIDISKIESGHIDIELSDFELHEVVSEAISNIRQQAETKSLALNVNISQQIALYTDRRRLLQCILNFLSNAIKYSEQGQIQLFSEDQGNEVVISVRDTGIGITKEDIPRLFEAFERIDSHLRVKAGGTGLGLYLTKKIATELLHGEVGAKSKPGEGSTFWIRVPKILQQK